MPLKSPSRRNVFMPGAWATLFPIRQLPIRQLPIRQLPIRLFPTRQLPIRLFPTRQLPIRLFPTRQRPAPALPAPALQAPAVALATLVLLTACATLPDGRRAKVLIASDSTAAQYGPDRWPQMGWGMLVQCSLDASIKVDNRARGGRSTRTFIAEGLFDALAEQTSPGDTVLIQFGHNDATTAKPERYASPMDYGENLRHFIAVVRERKAQPVLLTPVAIRKFENGRMLESHAEYSRVAHEVAAETHTPLIDLDADSMAYFQSIGEEGSKKYYLHYTAADHVPAFPTGIADDTHFSELGARAVAALVARRLKELHIPLSKHVRPVKLDALQTAGDPSCGTPRK
jgi:lysophospholipase L1-like esterase